MCQAVQENIERERLAGYFSSPNFGRGHVAVRASSKIPNTPQVFVQVMPPRPEHILTKDMGLQTHIPAWFWGYPKYPPANIEVMMENQSQNTPRWSRQSTSWAGGSYPVSVPSSPRETFQNILGSGILAGNGSVTPFVSSFSASKSQLWPQCYYERSLSITSLKSCCVWNPGAAAINFK